MRRRRGRGCTPQLATANLKAALKRREDAVKEEGERHVRDVERAMRERTEEFDAKLKVPTVRLDRRSSRERARRHCRPS